MQTQNKVEKENLCGKFVQKIFPKLENINYLKPLSIISNCVHNSLFGIELRHLCRDIIKVVPSSLGAIIRYLTQNMMENDILEFNFQD